MALGWLTHGMHRPPGKVRRVGYSWQQPATMQLQKPVAVSHLSRAALPAVQHWLEEVPEESSAAVPRRSKPWCYFPLSKACERIIQEA